MWTLDLPQSIDYPASGAHPIVFCQVGAQSLHFLVRWSPCASCFWRMLQPRSVRQCWSTPSLEVAPIQNLRVGSGAFAHTLLTTEEADPSGGGKTKICLHFDYALSTWRKSCWRLKYLDTYPSTPTTPHRLDWLISISHKLMFCPLAFDDELYEENLLVLNDLIKFFWKIKGKYIFDLWINF